MAVLVQAVTVIIVNSALEQRFPGGLRAFEQSWSGPTYCSDGRISAVAFMSLEDARRFTTLLAARGFADPWATPARDIAVAIQGQGLLTPADWLKVDRRALDETPNAPEVTTARLVGEELETFSAPPGWNARALESLTPITLDEYELQGTLHSDGGGEVLVYRHKETGVLRYVARPDLPVDDTQSRYEKLLQDLLELETSPATRRRDERLAALLEHCKQLVEANGVSEPRWLHAQGLAARLRGQWRQAEHAFRRLTELRPAMLVGWFELTVALAKLDRVDEAEAAARQAVMIDPASPAAQGNLASALLQQGNTRAALEAIRVALVLDTSNALNQLILQRVQESMSDDDNHSEDRPKAQSDGADTRLPWH